MDTAIRHRPPWILPLGQPPEDPEAKRQWQGHVAIIAAYRDQQKITTSDPRQVLGPYPARGHAGHRAYWHAAGSVLAARQLAGLEPAGSAGDPDTQVHAQVAADIYRALPADERAAISQDMAATLGPLWFGDRAAPDEDAATQSVHATCLTSTLTAHGHMTIAMTPTRRQPAPGEPLEAGLARRGPTRKPAPTKDQGRGPAPQPLLEPPTRYVTPAERAPQHRLG